jgi:hypothetical protein
MPVTPARAGLACTVEMLWARRIIGTLLSLGKRQPIESAVLLGSRAWIAAISGTVEADVSVRGTNTNGLGFSGTQEVTAATVVVLLSMGRP